MGYYINQKCGSCNKSLTGGYVGNYSGIGEPFVTCDKCGVINNNSDRVNEWKIKSPTSRLLFVFQHILSVVFYYGFGAAFAGSILLAKNFINSMAGFVAIVGCSIALGLLRFFFRITKAIEASNARMENASYIAKLKSLRLY